MINPKHPLAKLLAEHPHMARALEGSLARQQEAKVGKPAPLRLVTADCPHCGAEGVKYATLGKGEYARDYYHRREDCCQAALLDAALSALRYAMNPHGEVKEQEEAEADYKRLRPLITDPALKAELQKCEQHLAGIADRVTGLTSSQGGGAWGRW